MENINAFPSQEIDWKESAIQGRTVYENQHFGMTLRDYFANSAMQGLISNFKGDVSANYEIISIVSYKIADEMLKQRKK